MATENKGIYFTELTLKNVRCFGDEAVLKLSNDKGEWTRWNVILGDNGTGKTTLLQCLAGMEIDPDNFYGITSGKRIQSTSFFKPKLMSDFRTITPVNGSSTEIWANTVDTFSNSKSEIFAKQFSFEERPAQTGWTKDSFRNKRGEIEFFILGYGANRRISFQILTEKELNTEISATLFDDDAKLINTEEWLYQMDYAAAYAENRDTDSKNYTRKRRDLIFELLLGILPDIEEIKFIPKDDPSNPRPVMRFKTPYGWVGIKELSYGYKTMVAWIVDVGARMFKHYPESDNPLEEPVIILVDEIDLHLHPRWQRQIFEFLEKRFPRAQFIVTAHSPLIVQSAPKDANIIVLKKEQVGDEFVVKIDNDKKSVWSWRLDQIMASDLFGLDGLRNPEIERQMKERSELLRRNDLNEFEKKRLDELNEISYSLPTADNPADIEAMEIIRQAAAYLKNKQMGA